MGKPKTRPAIPGKGVATLHEWPASTWAPLEPLPSTQLTRPAAARPQAVVQYLGGGRQHLVTGARAARTFPHHKS
jgi:hypothetical protein